MTTDYERMMDRLEHADPEDRYPYRDAAGTYRDTITLYCSSASCRHTWPAVAITEPFTGTYRDLEDEADAWCPVCGSEGEEERPAWDAEAAASADTACELCGGETSAAGTCDRCWDGAPSEE